MWALGLTAYEMIFGWLPTRGISLNVETAERLGTSARKAIMSSERLLKRFGPQGENDAWQFAALQLVLQGLLWPEPNRRLTADEALHGLADPSPATHAMFLQLQAGETADLL